MSLINDALKKAQKQRTGETPTLASMPSVGGESPQRIARRAKPPGFDSLMLRAGIGAAVVVVLAVGGFFFLREKPQDSIQQSAISNQPATGQAPSSPPPAPGSVAPAQQPTANNAQLTAQPAAPTFTLPLAPAPSSSLPAPSSTNVGGTSRPDAPPSPAATAATPAPKTTTQQPATSNQQLASAPAAVVERPKLEPRAIEFIENIKVAGIRVSATDPKVLMNDRVYRPGSQVSAEFGLTLVEIATGSLTFEDAAGGRYTRTF